MILLADANVLIDLCLTDGLDVLPRIASTEVLDVVLDECDHPKQPRIREQVYEAGIRVISVQYDWLYEADQLRTPNLSTQDSLNLFFARKSKRVLLSNDGPLRERCQELQVEFHGTLWMIEEIHRRNLVEPPKLCRWISILSTSGRRMPPVETKRIKQLIGCT
ncbi:hypothetical protein HMPREF9374_1102 [Desmospora sp. 8437]|nr:hypothetical protein HMPREF9374_1102 [Desmospora sp. 8437]